MNLRCNCGGELVLMEKELRPNSQGIPTKCVRCGAPTVVPRHMVGVRELTGGYDGPGGDQQLITRKIWELVRPPAFHSARVVRQLICNGKSRGLIYFDDEEEAAWVAERIKGVQEVSHQKT